MSDSFDILLESSDRLLTETQSRFVLESATESFDILLEDGDVLLDEIGRRFEAEVAPDISNRQQLIAVLKNGAGGVYRVAPGDYGVLSSNDIPSRNMLATPIVLVASSSVKPHIGPGTGFGFAMDIRFWKGLSFFGFRFSHDEVGLTYGSTIGCVRVQSTDGIAFEGCEFHGALVPTGTVDHKAVGVVATRNAALTKNLTLRANKFHKLERGAYITNPHTCIWESNLLTLISSDGLNPNCNITNVIIQDNLFTEFDIYNPGVHADGIQANCYSGTDAADDVEDYVNGLIIRRNLMAFFTDQRRANNGIHLGVENLSSSNNNITVEDNDIVAAAGNAMIMNNVGGSGNSWSRNLSWAQLDNGVYGGQIFDNGTGPAYHTQTIQIMRWGSTSSTGLAVGLYTGNVGQHNFTNGLTDGGGNVSATPTLTKAQILAKIDNFRLLNPTIPF